MSKTIVSFSLIIICSLLLLSQETKRTVVFYNKSGEKSIIDFNEISSLKLDLIDSFSYIHIYYKNKNLHYIYPGIELDSVSFNHKENSITIITKSIIENHIIDSIDIIKINCEKLVVPHDSSSIYRNPDSVMVDSCNNPNKLVAKKKFLVIFEHYIVNLPPAPKDTILDITWESFSSTFTSEREEFEELENKFGSYILRKINPDIIDSSHVGSRGFYIIFENYVDIDSVKEYLRNCHYIESSSYLSRVRKMY